jgi:hypothetical protein
LITSGVNLQTMYPWTRGSSWGIIAFLWTKRY